MNIRHKGDYRKSRQAQYPSVEEQLDMLWHAMNNGNLPKAEPFYGTIKQVKQKSPKPVIN